MVTQKVSRQAWLQKACSALRRGGFPALQVEPLALELGVTKGSFYWHFKDRGALVEALLAAWEDETLILIERASQAAAPLVRLTSFFVHVEETVAYPPDHAVFELALADRSVAARARRVEERRIAFCAEQLRAVGLSEEQADAAAEIVYCTTVGWLEFARRRGRRPAGFADAAERVIAGQLALVITADELSSGAVR